MESVEEVRYGYEYTPAVGTGFPAIVPDADAAGVTVTGLVELDEQDIAPAARNMHRHAPPILLVGSMAQCPPSADFSRLRRSSPARTRPRGRRSPGSRPSPLRSARP